MVVGSLDGCRFTNIHTNGPSFGRVHTVTVPCPAQTMGLETGIHNGFTTTALPLLSSCPGHMVRPNRVQIGDKFLTGDVACYKSPSAAFRRGRVAS